MKKEVGLRELKNRLSEYVSRVKSGHALLVTDRGQPVAELRPISGKTPGQLPRLSLEDLVQTGLLITGKPNDAKVYPRMRRIARRSSVELLDEERGER